MKMLEFVKSFFDGEAVVVKEVGGLKAGWEEQVQKVFQGVHPGMANATPRRAAPKGVFWIHFESWMSLERRDLVSQEWDSVALL